MDIVFFAISLAIGGYFTGNGFRILLARRIVLMRADAEPHILTGQPIIRIGILHICTGLIFALVGLQIAGIVDIFPSPQARSLVILVGLVVYAYNSMYIANLRKMA